MQLEALARKRPRPSNPPRALQKTHNRQPAKKIPRWRSASTTTPASLSRCIRGCDEVKSTFVLGRRAKVIPPAHRVRDTHIRSMRAHEQHLLWRSVCSAHPGPRHQRKGTWRTCDRQPVGRRKEFEARGSLQIPFSRRLRTPSLKLNRGGRDLFKAPLRKDATSQLREGDFWLHGFY